MRRLEKICKKHNISLCYLFGSLQQVGKALLEGNPFEYKDSESDIDFAVLFLERPENSLVSYATLSMELQDLVSPFKADLLFYTKRTILSSLKRSKELIFIP